MLTAQKSDKIVKNLTTYLEILSGFFFMEYKWKQFGVSLFWFMEFLKILKCLCTVLADTRYQDLLDLFSICMY